MANGWTFSIVFPPYRDGICCQILFEEQVVSEVFWKNDRLMIENYGLTEPQFFCFELQDYLNAIRRAREELESRLSE